MKRKRSPQLDDDDEGRRKRPRTRQAWKGVFDGLAEAFKNEEADSEEKSHGELFVSPAQAILTQVSIADPFAEIQRRIDRLHKTFQLGWEEGKAPYYYQEVMFDHMNVMSMRWIVGSDAEFERLKPMLMQRLGMDRWLRSYDQIMPRQYGKTEGICNGLKSLAMHLPMRIPIFAQGARNSEQDLKLTKDAMKRALPPSEHWRFLVDKVDEFRFQVIALDPRHEGKCSVVKAYPSSGDSKLIEPDTINPVV